MRTNIDRLTLGTGPLDDPAPAIPSSVPASAILSSDRLRLTLVALLIRLLFLPLLLLSAAHPGSILMAQFAGGSGTESDPFRVETADQLQSVRNHAHRHFLQSADIDAGTIPDFIPIGDYPNPFSGTFDGDGYTISGLTIELCPVCPGLYVGLFGRIFSGQIRNVHIQNADVSGRDNVGILAGYNAGDIRSSSASGTVSGRDHTGGLVGWNEGSITHSRTDANVNGSMSVGGLSGYNSGTIDDSYARTDVKGSYETGGLAGVNERSGIITASYASGPVAGESLTGGLLGYNGGDVKASYWDREATQQNDGVGQGSPDGTTGLTTALMTGTDAYYHMPALDFKAAWLLTEGYPALFWEDVDALDLPTSSEDEAVAAEFKLRQNHPNPFNPVTRISYSLPEQARVRLVVYNLLGQPVATLVDEVRGPGVHMAAFDASGLSGGTYLYRIQAGTYRMTRAMILVK